MNTNDLGENHGNAVQAGYVGHLTIGAPAERLPVPRQLPRAVSHFTGRTAQFAALDDVLREGTVAAVVGMAGVGKTALVVRWAHQVQHQFPDGTLYVNLRGYGPSAAANPGDVLADFLGALGIGPERIPPRQDARAALYRSALAGRRVLVVLDNANGVEQVRALLPGGPGCVVVTSRSELRGLEVAEGATRISLPLFTEEEALGLVHAALGPRSSESGTAALVQACARLPLALRIAASRVATQPHFTVSELVEDLRAQRWEALTVPEDERSAVRTVFDWSYHRLPPAQALMFRRLGLHPGPEIGVPAAAVLSGYDPRTTRNLLAGLAEQHLVEQVGRDRYVCHDLLRAYAVDLAERDDDRDQAVRLVLDWAAHHVKATFRMLYPDRPRMHAGADVVTKADAAITFSSPDEAWAWVDAESVNAVATVEAAARTGLDEITMLLGDLCAAHLGMAGHFDDGLLVCVLGLDAARRLGHRRGECLTLKVLGQLQRGMNMWAEAAGLFAQALEIAHELGDEALAAEVLGHHGWGCLELGQYVEARVHLEEGLRLCADDGRLRGFIEFCLSGVHAGLGDHERAWQHAQRCLAIRERGASIYGGYAWHAMARARQVAGAHAEAVAFCERALAEKDLHGNPRNHAVLLDTLGASLLHTGDRARALACWREALAIFEERGDHRAPDLRERLAAEVSASSG
ncbi:NB-ARC domain-containing protein [Lentzea sp. NPDC005914]|uniref:ATP-binding protein n=1 Tax=Lentzea sp. NPDC005914 TaxID=3154572 RepID=UPI003409E70E